VDSFRNSIRQSNAGAYLLYFLSFLLFSTVSAMLIQALGFHVTTIVTEIVGILGAAIIWRWVVSDAAAPWPSFKLRVSVWAVLSITAASVALGFLANSIAAFVIEVSPAMQKIAEAYSERIAELLLEATGVERVLGIIGVCVAAPICEEALFRGTILQEQRKSEKVWVAVAVNGLLFSAFHLNPVSAIGLVFAGAFFAHITVRSGSLIPAIIAHAVLNTANAIVLPALAPEDATMTEVPIELSELLMLIGLLGVLSAFFWWLSMHLINARARAADQATE
jgi:membrane protease YdiL (CAAX protease family)